MIGFLLSCCAAWLVFAILDGLFKRRRKPHGKQFVIQDGNGLYWVVEEREQEEGAPDALPANVVRFPGGRS